MTTKKLVNDPSRAVDDMLAGAVLMNPGIVKMDNRRVLLRSGKKCISLLSKTVRQLSIFYIKTWRTCCQGRLPSCVAVGQGTNLPSLGMLGTEWSTLAPPDPFLPHRHRQKFCAQFWDWQSTIRLESW